MLKILLSRTDKIGDVILTLPMAGILKSINQTIKIVFLGNAYTKDIVDCCKYIDEFIHWDQLKKNKNPSLELKKYQIDIAIHIFPNKEFAKLCKISNIKTRIGTNRRWFHILYCNKLVNLTRKKSSLHEALLNIKLLSPLKKLLILDLLHNDLKQSAVWGYSRGLFENFESFDKLLKIDLQNVYHYYGFTKIKPLPEIHAAKKLIHAQKFNLIIHPRSGGSAQEWGADNILELISYLPTDKFNIFFTGSKEERAFIQKMQAPKHIHNVAGLMSLDELISFIHSCDGLIAASTGPLHIAAALNKHVIGLYPSEHSMSKYRWGALGPKVQNLEIARITPSTVYLALLHSTPHVPQQEGAL